MSGSSEAGQRPARQGTLLAVYGPKAGVGTSVIACNLAVALAEATGEQVVLADAHPQFGSLATLLGLESEDGERRERHALPGGLVDGPSGVRVWLAEAAAEACPAGAAPPLERLQAGARYVVVDLPSVIDAVTANVLEQADRVLLVVAPEAAAVRHGRAFLRWCEGRALLPKVGVVVNRHASESALPEETLERAFGARVVARLPSDGRRVVESVNLGRPLVELAPDCPLSQRVRALARRLAGL